jgi:hypothetical protein
VTVRERGGGAHGGSADGMGVGRWGRGGERRERKSGPSCWDEAEI